jgi:hypothetical protein
MALAVYECVGDEEDELTFKKGDLICLTETPSEAQWWKGYCLTVRFSPSPPSSIFGCLLFSFSPLASDLPAIFFGFHSNQWGP